MQFDELWFYHRHVACANNSLGNPYIALLRQTCGFAGILNDLSGHAWLCIPWPFCL